MKNILDQKFRLQLIDRIYSLTYNSKGLWGKMNVDQMVRHCRDQIRMSQGEIETDFAGSFFSVNVIKYLVLLGMPIPKGKIETVKELRQSNEKFDEDDFKKNKTALVELIEKFGESIDSFPKHRHPAFGKMSKNQWGKLVYIHTDYHLKQFGN